MNHPLNPLQLQALLTALDRSCDGTNSKLGPKVQRHCRGVTQLKTNVLLRPAGSHREEVGTVARNRFRVAISAPSLLGQVVNPKDTHPQHLGI